MDPDGSPTRPDPERVFRVLSDDDCREIVSALAEPMTVEEVAEATDGSLTTAYRKLEKLAEADLVREDLELRSGGHHRSRYVSAFERLTVSLDDDRRFRIDRLEPEPGPEKGADPARGEFRSET